METAPFLRASTLPILKHLRSLLPLGLLVSARYLFKESSSLFLRKKSKWTIWERFHLSFPRSNTRKVETIVLQSGFIPQSSISVVVSFFRVTSLRNLGSAQIADDLGPAPRVGVDAFDEIARGHVHRQSAQVGRRHLRSAALLKRIEKGSLLSEEDLTVSLLSFQEGGEELALERKNRRVPSGARDEGLGGGVR